jgi:hypothetical protein
MTYMGQRNHSCRNKDKRVVEGTREESQTERSRIQVTNQQESAMDNNSVDPSKNSSRGGLEKFEKDTAKIQRLSKYLKNLYPS